MRSILGLTLALILTACGSEPPSLAITDAAADKHLNAKLNFNPYTKYGIEHKERTKLEEKDGGIYNVWYKYTIKSNYDFTGHTHAKAKAYYQKLNADGLVGLAGSMGGDVDLKMLLTLAQAILGGNSLVEAMKHFSEAEKILKTLENPGTTQAVAFDNAVRRCGISCKDAVEEFPGNPIEKLINNYAYLLALNEMGTNNLNIPETDTFPVDIQFQVETEK